jgi:hypothetical protein
MSPPARIGTQMSASALVRENPRINMDDSRAALLGFHDPAEPDRVSFCQRGAFNKMQSALVRSCCAVAAPPRPKEVPRPGTVLLSHIRARLDIHTIPRPSVKSFRIR